MLDISDIIHEEFGTPATLNGVTLASGAVIRTGADVGMQTDKDTPMPQRTTPGDYAKITIRKADLPSGVSPKYRDVVSDGVKDWHLQPNITELGGTFECIAVGQFRAKGGAK